MEKDIQLWKFLSLIQVDGSIYADELYDKGIEQQNDDPEQRAMNFSNDTNEGRMKFFDFIP